MVMNWMSIMKKFTLRKQVLKVGDYVENTALDYCGGIVTTLGESPYYGKSGQYARVQGWWLDDNGVIMNNTWAEWFPVSDLVSLGKADELYRAGLIPAMAEAV